MKIQNCIFFVALFLVSCGGGGGGGGNIVLGPVTIDAGKINFEAGVISVSEDSGITTVNLQRSSGTDGPLRVTVISQDNTARAGVDYNAVNEVIDFTDGVTQGSFSVTLIDNSAIDGQRDFVLTLDVDDGSAIGNVATVNITIIDDDILPNIVFSSLPVIHATRITISTNGLQDFGVTGPTLLNRTTLRGVPNGSQVSTSSEEGRGIISAGSIGMPTVEDVDELPYGKAMQIGAESSANNDESYRMMKVVDNVVHTEFYESVYIYWPSNHQATAASSLNGTARWQVKPIWHFLSVDGYRGGNGDTDLFAGWPMWSGSSLKWSDGFRITGNSRPQSTLDNSPSGLRDAANDQLWRSSPLYRQLWIKAGPTPGNVAGSDGMYRLSDTVSGKLVQSIYTNNRDFTESGSTTPGFDRYNIPGFVRGFNIPLSMHAYMADVYQAVGPGAVARVEITDNVDYDLSTKYSACTVTSWSSSSVEAEVREGIFYNQSLSGLHLHLHDMNNNHLYVGQIP